MLAASTEILVETRLDEPVVALHRRLHLRRIEAHLLGDLLDGVAARPHDFAHAQQLLQLGRRGNHENNFLAILLVLLRQHVDRKSPAEILTALVAEALAVLVEQKPVQALGVVDEHGRLRGRAGHRAHQRLP